MSVNVLPASWHCFTFCFTKCLISGCRDYSSPSWLNSSGAQADCALEPPSKINLTQAGDGMTIAWTQPQGKNLCVHIPYTVCSYPIYCVVPWYRLEQAVEIEMVFTVVHVLQCMHDSIDTVMKVRALYRLLCCNR